MNNGIKIEQPEDLQEMEIGTDGVILQWNEYTCGPAAILNFIKDLGISTTFLDRELIIKLVRTMHSGASMFDMVEGLNQLGFEAYGVRMKDIKTLKKEFKELRIPIILYFEKRKHYVLLEGMSRNSCLIVDPARGKVILGLKRLKKLWSGHAIIILLEK